MLKILDSVDAIIDETPPVNNEKSRFGNPAFRTFYDAVQKVVTSLTSVIQPT